MCAILLDCWFTLLLLFCYLVCRTDLFQVAKYTFHAGCGACVSGCVCVWLRFFVLFLIHFTWFHWPWKARHRSSSMFRKPITYYYKFLHFLSVLSVFVLFFVSQLNWIISNYLYLLFTSTNGERIARNMSVCLNECDAWWEGNTIVGFAQVNVADSTKIHLTFVLSLCCRWFVECAPALIWVWKIWKIHRIDNNEI